MGTKRQSGKGQQTLLVVLGTALLLFAVCVIPSSFGAAMAAQHQVMSSHGPGTQALPAASFDLFFSVAIVLPIGLAVCGRQMAPAERLNAPAFSRDAHHIRPPPSL